MTQAELIFPPATHRADPLTSYKAEERITKSGKRQTQAERVLDALKRYPNRTPGELSRDSGLDYYVIHRRLADLKANNLAHVTGRRECETGRGECQVWNPA